jgi:Protein of unknown function (DUF5131)/Bifunctional DNA primase/polymerase, N-terminal
MNTKKTQLQRALEYASYGWAVLPVFGFTKQSDCACGAGASCQRSGKHPRTANGVHSATTNADQITAWWTKWPYANIGLPAHGPFPDWLISGGESGGGARPVKRRWIRDVIADCRQHGVAPFHKQWGSYGNNPLVVNKGMSVKEVKGLDAFGKGGGLVDGKLVREFPVRRNAAIGGKADITRTSLEGSSLPKQSFSLG